MLGPGFHKAAIEFIDRLQQAIGTRFEVEDETDYYTERDFEAMKKKHFHKWLAKLFEIIQEQEDKGSFPPFRSHQTYPGRRNRIFCR